MLDSWEGMDGGGEGAAVKGRDEDREGVSRAERDKVTNARE